MELLGFELPELWSVHAVDDGAVQARLHLLEEVRALAPRRLVAAAAPEERRRARSLPDQSLAKCHGY